jgi:phage-related protein
MKKVSFLGDSLEVIKGFNKKAKEGIGFQLDRVQRGLEPADYKPMATVGAGVREIRVKAGSHHRVFYIVAKASGVYVLHAFIKKTQKTPKKEIDIAKSRLRDLERNEDDQED